MNKRKLIAGLLALTMTASLCGCGTSKTEPEAAPESVTAESEAAENEASAADSPEQDSEAADPELAEIKKIADAFFKANDEQDYEALAKIYDADLLYYLENEKIGTEEEILQYLKDNTAQAVPIAGQSNSFEISEPECRNEQAEEFNKFFEEMDKSSNTELAKNFHVDGVYIINMKTKGSSAADDSGAEADAGFDLDLPLAVLHINGEWKCDMAVNLTMSMYNAFSQMDDDFEPFESDADNAADADSSKAPASEEAE